MEPGGATAGIRMVTKGRNQPGCNRRLTGRYWGMGQDEGMLLHRWGLLRQGLSCWNWKCGVMSATARSVVYLAAMARGGAQGRLAVVLVEMGYVTLTAGVYAGLQQRALGLRSRTLGNLVVAAGVPGLAQALDWLAHRVMGAAVTGRTTLAVMGFAVVSALFHLYVMRKGVFLTGCGRSLGEDFRRLPQVGLGLVKAPAGWWGVLTARAGQAESEAAF
jgi:hypothetical protein